MIIRTAVWGTSVSRHHGGPIEDIHWNPLDHYNTIVLRGLMGAFNFYLIMPRDACSKTAPASIRSQVVSWHDCQSQLLSERCHRKWPNSPNVEFLIWNQTEFRLVLNLSEKSNVVCINKILKRFFRVWVNNIKDLPRALAIQRAPGGNMLDWLTTYEHTYPSIWPLRGVQFSILYRFTQPTNNSKVSVPKHKYKRG